MYKQIEKKIADKINRALNFRTKRGLEVLESDNQELIDNLKVVPELKEPAESIERRAILLKEYAVKYQAMELYKHKVYFNMTTLKVINAAIDRLGRRATTEDYDEVKTLLYRVVDDYGDAISFLLDVDDIKREDIKRVMKIENERYRR